jgi:hypothetical protein
MTHEGHTRGWGHVTLPAACADAAVAALDGTPFLCDAPTPPGAPTAWTLHVARITDKRDMLFPHLTREQRAALRLDSVAVHCVADGATADRCVSLLAAMMALGAHADTPAEGATWRAVDGCACAGGTALALARCPMVSRVDAVEMEPRRAAALLHNAAVCGVGPSVLRVHCADLTEPPASQLSADSDLLFLDPPWGGAHYSSSPVIEAHALGLSDVPIETLVCEARANGCRAVAVSTPRNYDDSSLAAALTQQRAGESRCADRALPFRAQLGARVLLIFLFPRDAEEIADETIMAAEANADAERSRFAFPTSLLDGAPRAERARSRVLALACLRLRARLYADASRIR